MDFHLKEKQLATAEFFREIGIVTIGLLIALMLQNLVGVYRDFKLRADTRIALQQEVEANIRLLRYDQQSVQRLQIQLATVARAVQLHRSGEGTPFLSLQMDYRPATDLIWKTAIDDHAVELLPLREQRRDAERYRLAAELDSDWDRALPSLYEIPAILTHHSDGSNSVFSVEDLSPTEIESLELSIARARVALGIVQQNLDRNLRFYDSGERLRPSALTRE